jgi:hypothetical protein
MNSIGPDLRIAALVGLFVGASSPIIGIHAQGAQSRTIREAGRTDLMPTEVTYPQVYATPDGETHFREIRVALMVDRPSLPAQPVAQSALQPATTIRHIAVPPNWGVPDRDQKVFHSTSSARFVTVRRGVFWVRTTDGETRRFQAGDVFEVQDVAPSKGHITWVGDEGAIALFSNHP